jgi:hypothetical protein
MNKFLSKKIAALLLAGITSLNVYAVENEQVNTPATPTEVQPTQEVTPAPKAQKTSSRKKTDKFKQETLSLGQGACIFCTVGKDPYIKTIKPDIDELKVIKCGKSISKTANQKVKNPQDLEYLSPLCITTLNYGGNTKSVVKYRGDREAFVGRALEYILLPLETYTGTLLVDEFKANIPMFWILNNVDELVAIKNYFEKNLSPEFVPSQKTLLVLKINSDQKLETLDKDCKTFLSKYFEIYPLTDSDVMAFFGKTLESISSTSFDMEGSNPLYVGETIMQSIFRQVEKGSKRFQAKDIIIAFGVTAFGALVLKEIDRDVDFVFKALAPEKPFAASCIDFLKNTKETLNNKIISLKNSKNNTATVKQ